MATREAEASRVDNQRKKRKNYPYRNKHSYPSMKDRPLL